MTEVAQNVLELLDAYDTHARGRVIRASEPLWGLETVLEAFNLIRAALVATVHRTVLSDLTDGDLKS